MAVSASRKASAAFLILVFSAGTGAAFLPAYLATRAIHAFCDGLAPGTPLTDVKSRADAAGYRYDKLGEDHALVEHPKSLGRAYCEIWYDAQGTVARRSADN
jgi:hypothetical protein